MKQIRLYNQYLPDGFQSFEELTFVIFVKNFLLASMKYLLILKILTVTLFRGFEEAILTMKTLSGTRLRPEISYRKSP